MGNKIGRRRQAVEERYTRPQGLYQHKDVDHKKLRKLILDSKLAPCYPGDEDCAVDLEECPICFLFYPSLNRSRCCMKGICTECFLQMKPPHTTRPTQCPFCKTSNYAVEYRGVRSKEEKGIEQIEEQRVIEAQIRIRQKQLQDDEERLQKRDLSSPSIITSAVETEYCNLAGSSLTVPACKYPVDVDQFASSQGLHPMPLPACIRPTAHKRENRDNNFDLDLEDIMVMEAIWLSIQEHGTQRNLACDGSILGGPSSSEGAHAMVPQDASPSGGLACAVAALAERQHMNHGESAGAPVPSNVSPAFDMLPCSVGLPPVENRVNYTNYPPDNWMQPCGMVTMPVPKEDDNEWMITDHRSDLAEAGTSYSSSDVTLDTLSIASSMQEGAASVASGYHLVPENFEEQMMLAMAVSLAEARAQTSPQGVAWL